MKKMLAVGCMAVLLAGSGCGVASRSGQVYSRDAARGAIEVYPGVVEEVREVMIEGTQSTIGALAGGVAGGVIGSTIGGGRGTRLATVGGALGGAAAGSAAEEALTRRPGLEIQVALDDGRTLVVVQEADIEFRPGDHVRVLRQSDGTHRVRN